MKAIAVDDLPGEPLAAASVFDQHWLPYAEETLAAGDHLMLAFAIASLTIFTVTASTRGSWRNSVSQM